MKCSEETCTNLVTQYRRIKLNGLGHVTAVALNIGLCNTHAEVMDNEDSVLTAIQDKDLSRKNEKDKNEALPK